jgi:hypothetical protein
MVVRGCPTGGLKTHRYSAGRAPPSSRGAPPRRDTDGVSIFVSNPSSPTGFQRHRGLKIHSLTG